MFYKKAVLKNFALFKGKHLCWSLFWIKLQAFRTATLFKRDFNTGVFLRILRNFLKTLILKNICKRLFLDLVINHWNLFKVVTGKKHTALNNPFLTYLQQLPMRYRNLIAQRKTFFYYCLIEHILEFIISWYIELGEYKRGMCLLINC